MSTPKQKPKTSISVAITGSGGAGAGAGAGAGMMTAGTLLLEVAAQAGWYDWKQIVRPASVTYTDDAALAARRIITDDGFNIGILYKGERKPYQPPIGKGRKQASDLETEFAL